MHLSGVPFTISIFIKLVMFSADNRIMSFYRLLRHSYLIIALLVTIAVLAAYKPGRPVGERDVGLIGSQETIPMLKRTPVVVRTVESEIAFGRTLAGLLTDSGFTEKEAFDVVESLAEVIDMRRIRSGQNVAVDFTQGEIPLEVRLPIRFDRTVSARRTERGWRTEDVMIDVVPNPVRTTAVIETSLYMAAKNSGIPLSVMMKAIDLFSFEVDFQREIHAGDSVEMLYEMLEDADGRVLAAGELLFARLTTAGRSVEAWRYERLDATVDYYEENGDSVRKSIIKTPVDGAKLSSGFGLRRHPILGYTALHRGVDFAVPAGTPVKAAGDGTVMIAGWHDQYGNRVKIRHANHYDTMYAHFSRISPGIRKGMEVKQGKIVGYVGSTGMSTGPHFHYEVHYYGAPVNPTALKFPPGHSLEGEDRRLFDLNRRALIADFDLK